MKEGLKAPSMRGKVEKGEAEEDMQWFSLEVGASFTTNPGVSPDWPCLY